MLSHSLRELSLISIFQHVTGTHKLPTEGEQRVSILPALDLKKIMSVLIYYEKI